jgi:transposase
MRYELTDPEWAAIKPMLSNTSHAVSHEPPCPQSMGRSRGGLTTRFQISGTVAFI